MAFFSNFGNAIKDVAKVVTDTTETVVQKSGVGAVAESIGIVVDEDIHNNGLNSAVTGLIAQVATRGHGDKLESKLKVKTADGDFGAKGDATAKDGEVTIANASAAVDSRGASASASVGAMVNSGFGEIKTITDVATTITNIMDKIKTSSRGEIVQRVLDETRMNVNVMLKLILEEVLKNSPLGQLSDLLLEVKGGKAKIYLDLGLSVTVGLGAALKCGMEEEHMIQGKKQTFKMYEVKGEFAVAGVSGGAGYSNKGKTFDGFDQGVYLCASGGSTFSVSVALIITTNVSSGLGTSITKMKNMIERP
jgi:hypothetical protein